MFVCFQISSIDQHDQQKLNENWNLIKSWLENFSWVRSCSFSLSASCLVSAMVAQSFDVNTSHKRSVKLKNHKGKFICPRNPRTVVPGKSSRTSRAFRRQISHDHKFKYTSVWQLTVDRHRTARWICDSTRTERDSFLRNVFVYTNGLLSQIVRLTTTEQMCSIKSICYRFARWTLGITRLS